MAEQFEISDEMKAQIGWESSPWRFEVTTTSVRAFARGVGYTDPVYFDIDAAKKAGYRSMPAPPTYLGTPVFMPGKTDDTFSHPLDARPDIKHGLTGLLDGGTETEYFDTICAGDTLTVVTQLKNLEVKDSKSLGKMLIITTETSFKNQEKKLVALQRGQGIYY
ncbi:MAG: MaoC family dehydratase N-terminal domain-containing protein [Deltaproteobacteria bacterium]|nr:MaoC family dehydratase N-terminal domain-containing protein [Deltaproteobacteria bacterium]